MNITVVENPVTRLGVGRGACAFELDLITHRLQMLQTATFKKAAGDDARDCVATFRTSKKWRNAGEEKAAKRRQNKAHGVSRG